MLSLHPTRDSDLLRVRSLFPPSRQAGRTSSLPTSFRVRRAQGPWFRSTGTLQLGLLLAEALNPPHPAVFFPCQFRPGQIAPSSGREETCNYVMQRRGCCCSGASWILSFNGCIWDWEAARRTSAPARISTHQFVESYQCLAIGAPLLRH